MSNITQRLPPIHADGIITARVRFCLQYLYRLDKWGEMEVFAGGYAARKKPVPRVVETIRIFCRGDFACHLIWNN
jgi:hypothetical protein